MDYFIGCFKKYADFTDRARRAEFWYFQLFALIVNVVLSLIAEFTGVSIFGFIFSIVVILPSLAVGARRLHDTGRSGWWQLIALIPLIGIIVLIVFWAQDSHSDNEYGANPKAV
ncbi:MAG: DUF805 domain-containing protein [Parashewanella sp.]